VFERWGLAISRRRWPVLGAALILVTLAAVWGTGVFSRLLTSDSFIAPGSQSETSATLAAQAFGRDDGDVVVLYRSPRLTVGAPAFRSAVEKTLTALPGQDVASYASYWSTGSRQFVSASGHETYAVIELTGGTDAVRIIRFDAIAGQLTAPGLTVQVGGQIPTEQAINNEVTADISRAEVLSMPVLLVLLTVIFGSVAAALLPLAIGGIGILGSFTALRLLTLVTPVSIYSVNITTIMGLGLAIDYGLFMVGRFREELDRQPDTATAVARTMATAGRTVAVSGVTVACAIAGLILFPETFLRSMGYGGVATVLVDMLAALVVMPALLALLGPRVNGLRVRRSAGRVVRDEQAGAWYRLARLVMRRPLAFAAVIVVLLLALSYPILHVTWGGTDASALPAAAGPSVVQETLDRDFPGHVTAPIEPVIQFGGPVTTGARLAQLDDYTAELRAVPGITGAQITGMHGNVARIDLGYTPDPLSAAARAIVGRVRAVAAPAGARVYVGGQTAQLADLLTSLQRILPWMALVMIGATFILLFLAFGSVLLPVKAIVMNALSLSATFGAVVWIFQDGHLSGLLRFTPTGTIDPTIPILMLAIIFGLSMDYEVFLLSRIRERYDLTGYNGLAVASGLQRTGGVITSAALLLVIVIGAFSASGITFIKLMGVGMIIALIVDAAIVRVLLVPATMRLLGLANWWAPGPLRRLYARYGIQETDQAAQSWPVPVMADPPLTRQAGPPLPRSQLEADLPAELVPELRAELVPELIAELRAELVPELIAELVPELRTRLVAELRADLVPELVAELRADLVPELRAELVPELIAELVPELRARLVPELIAKHAAELSAASAAAPRTILAPELQSRGKESSSPV
jgi:RND superfamily putative drug exporter